MPPPNLIPLSEPILAIPVTAVPPPLPPPPPFGVCRAKEKGKSVETQAEDPALVTWTP